MRTKVKILQHNGLDANSFCFSKTLKANKNCTNFVGSNKNSWDGVFWDGRQLESQEFFTSDLPSGNLFVSLLLQSRPVFYYHIALAVIKLSC